jgi:hypothetical protein
MESKLPMMGLQRDWAYEVESLALIISPLRLGLPD